MSWYFGVFCVVALCSAIWSAALIDKDALSRLPPAGVTECSKINDFLKIFALIQIGEMATCFLLAMSLPSIMRSANWAIFGLTSLMLMLLSYVAKLAGVVLGIVWVWARTGVACNELTPSLYGQASTFLICMIVLFAFQLMFGTSYLMCCGLEDAVQEGIHNVQRSYGGGKGIDEEDNLLSDQEGDELKHI